jgi:hypothetical protein
MTDPDGDFQPPKVSFATFLDAAKYLKEKDILTSLIFGGVVYAVWSMVTSSTTGLFKGAFRLNELLLGLVFLPNGTTTPLAELCFGTLSIFELGLGTIVGSTIIGKLLNKDFAHAERAYKASRRLPPDYKLSGKELPDDFPIEHARLNRVWWITSLFILSTAAYGWTLAFGSFTSKRGAIAVPLTLQFVIAATSNAVFAINQTLVSDLCPGKGASSTAINNLVRCSLGAVGVAFIEKMITSIGVGPSFLGLGLITTACVPLLALEWYHGTEWRLARVERIRMRKKVVRNGP